MDVCPDPAFFGFHLFGFGVLFVVVAEQVQNAVDEEVRDLVEEGAGLALTVGGLQADDDVAEDGGVQL